MSNNFLKAPCGRILKNKTQNLIYSVKLWQIHEYNGKSHYNLKFIFCTRLEQNLLFRFETFSNNLEMRLVTLEQKGSFLTTIIVDFNAKSYTWYSNDKTSFEGSTIESITSQFGLDQLINEPTHLLQNSSSFIDLIFTSQPNIGVESGVHPSLHLNCHHQIILVIFNLKIYYPPLCLQDVWHYKETNADLIKQATNNFIWEKAFSNTNINEKASLFNKTIFNILSSYIPHETIVFGDKHPPWFNSLIKSLIENKNKLCKNY